MVEDQPFHMVFVGIIVYWYLFMVEDQPFHMVFVGIIVIGNFLWWKTNLLTQSSLESLYIGDLLWLLAGLLTTTLTLASMMQKGSSLLRTARLFLCKGPITDILLLVIFLSMITILLIKYKRKIRVDPKYLNQFNNALKKNNWSNSYRDIILFFSIIFFIIKYALISVKYLIKFGIKHI